MVYGISCIYSKVYVYIEETIRRLGIRLLKHWKACKELGSIGLSAVAEHMHQHPILMGGGLHCKTEDTGSYS